MKKLSTVILAFVMLATAMMLSGCGESAADQAFDKFKEENDALVQSMLEPSEGWFNEPDGGEAIVLEEIGKVDKLFAGLGKLDKNAMSKDYQESYADIYDSFAAHRVTLEAMLEETLESMPDEPIAGGYSEDRVLDPDDLEVFEAAMGDEDDFVSGIQ